MRNLPLKIKIPKVLSFVICVLIFICHSVYAAEPPRYDIEAKIDTAHKKIVARQTVIFTNNSDQELNEVYFHIYPHRKYSESEKRFLLRYAAYFNINPYPEGFQSGDLKIKSASSLDKSLQFSIEGKDATILKIALDTALKPQESKAIKIDFQVDIPHAYGKFGWHKNIMSLLRWYPMLSVLDEEGWHNYPFYPFHQPYFSQAAIYKVSLTLPKEQLVIHSATLNRQTYNPDGTKTMLIASELPIRDFGLVISPDFQLISQELNGVKINAYYLAGDSFYAGKALEFASGLIEHHSKKFIPYPYKEFNIAPSFLGYGGTQSSNLILIDSRAYQLPGFLIRYFDFLISHETGHQWFYNLVGSDEYKEMFIDEGLNSYFILDYLNQKYGRDAQVMVLPKSLEWLIPNFSFSRAQLDRYSFVAKNGLDRPVLGKLSSFQEPSSIFSITYGKGSKIFDMLKFVMGEDNFKRLMQRYFKEFRFKNIKVQDLKALASQEAGKDLSWFFEGWLNTSFSCDYAVKKVKDNRIFLENRGRMQMPVEIEVELEKGEVLKYIWDDKNKEKEINIDSRAKIKAVSIDPKKRILDLDRTNNHWKRKFDIRAVALYHPVYEVPVFLKDDAYSVVVGPQVGFSELGVKSSLQKPQDNIFYISSAYNFNEERIKNSIGFEQRHLARKMLKWGIEAFDYNDVRGSADQEGFRLYLRRELWPASYGLLDENDHVTAYILRNRDFKSALTSGGLEDVKNIYYRQQEEAILGLNLKFGRYGTYPDPVKGWKLNFILENAEHFLGGQNYFWRVSPELSRYFSIDPQQKLAARVKLGLGFPADKGLFQLGGEKGLRGYAYKTINGSQAILFSGEYRLDLAKDLNLNCCDHLLALKKIQGVAFFDIGKAWFRSFNNSDFKKDVGLGLRFHCDIVGFLERLIFRIDIAKALNEPKEEPHVWLGISHAF
ncbi:MAG: hypothetical protein A2984_02755 [Omnitrophica WOR_2 bacterium RIFCSPLOWO2_01_FULL_41_12]|nr:MAG: hypothetical protein A2984_02755 [Omnitrophica WOR_2 bacterium RIFCSPLOWO2_01_FULL_41_12]